ncbi:Crp/Fnr family transcriptional regulator [Propionivibrio limicola]|uniref:Crp/Fnr family transcriptional regulator n=1 Tax=Propionivibrio limicola TaxID=167645 RepID=UPI0012920AD2|nr:Crp/Fnr family transcriptional regulator [Propionivibrio limicola]
MSDAYPPHPCQNHLLAALPANDYARLLPHLEAVPMPFGHVLYESGMPMRYVYFPATSIISLLYEMEDGRSAAIAIVGNEGLVGVAQIMGGETTPSRAVVHSAGEAYRLPAAVLMDEFENHASTQHLLLRYTQALLTQIAQTAVCNRHHTLEQQLCRLLLQQLDRLSADEFTLTQELIANMLGVRREGVTEAACHLHKAGLIEYHRGHITVLDRQGLEARVCECYAVVRREFARLLPELVTGAGHRSWSPESVTGVGHRSRSPESVTGAPQAVTPHFPLQSDTTKATAPTSGSPIP